MCPPAPPRAGALTSELKAGPGRGHGVSGSRRVAASPGGVHLEGIRLWLFLKDRSSGENYFINVTPNVIMEINKVAQGLNPSREEVNSPDMHTRPQPRQGYTSAQGSPELSMTSAHTGPPQDRPHDVGRAHAAPSRTSHVMSVHTQPPQGPTT